MIINCSLVLLVIFVKMKLGLINFKTKLFCFKINFLFKLVLFLILKFIFISNLFWEKKRKANRKKRTKTNKTEKKGYFNLGIENINCKVGGSYKF